jgi:hypothetical protein
LVGNSGRSPYPHIHFQLQATPSVGSTTLDYPIDHFIIENKNISNYQKPKLNEAIANIETSKLIVKALKFIPGQTLKVKYTKDDTSSEEIWKVKADFYNNLFIKDLKTNSYAYLYQDGAMHYFQNYTGSKQSVLYHFYLALFQIPLGYYPDITVKETIPSNLVFSKTSMFIQDFLIPFPSILKINYKMKFKDIDNEMMPSEIRLTSDVSKKQFSKTKNYSTYSILIKDGDRITIESDNNLSIIIVKE